MASWSLFIALLFEGLDQSLPHFYFTLSTNQYKPQAKSSQYKQIFIYIITGRMAFFKKQKVYGRKINSTLCLRQKNKILS